MNLYDAVVVGSGVTGGWAAKQLTQRGFKVLVLEAGPDLLARDIPTNVKERFSTATIEDRRTRQPTQSRHPVYSDANAHLFVDDLDHPYTTPKDHPFYWIRGRQVGGRSLTWGAFTPRMSELDFAAAERDGFGENWPLSYQDIAPYYDEVERFMGVVGTCEGLLQVPDGCFMPPHPMTAAEQRFKALVEGRWPDRRVIPARGIPTQHASRTGPETQWPAFSSQGSTLPVAARTGLLSMRSDAIVSHIEVDAETGSAKRVVFIDRNTRVSDAVAARVIVLAASTLESTRIMLHSISPRHPQGLGNSSGMLGRFLMDHPFWCNAGIVPDADPKAPVLPLFGPDAMYIPRFQNLERCTESFLRGYAVWGGVQRAIGLDRPGVQYTLVAICEMLPRYENHVALNKEQTDAWGIPTLHIDCEISDNENLMLASAQSALEEMCALAGFEPVPRLPLTTPGLFVHEMGTARMGRNARTSVLNPFNQCWDVKNLFVVDGSCFVTSGCQNPTLTMMALTVRACDYLVDKLKRGDL